MMNSFRIAAATLLFAAVAVAAPWITSIGPASDPTAGGITITLDDSGFGTTPTLAFNASPVAISTATDVKIAFVLPARSGTPNVFVKNSSETAQTTFNDPRASGNTRLSDKFQAY